MSRLAPHARDLAAAEVVAFPAARAGRLTGPFTGLQSVAHLNLPAALATEWGWCAVMGCDHPDPAFGAFYADRFATADAKVAKLTGIRPARASRAVRGACGTGAGCGT